MHTVMFNNMLSAGLRTLRNHFYNRIFNPEVKFPTYAFILIEKMCNSRCGYCDFWKMEQGNQPTKEEWKAIIDDLRSIGSVSITFSGGEPFLNRDLFEIAAYARSRGLLTMVVTNFSLFRDSHIEKVSKSFDFFGISIDSNKPEVYKEIRGVDWLERNKENIRKLMSGLAERKSDTIVCGMVTVSNKNAYETHEILHVIFDDLQMDTVSFNLLDPYCGISSKDFVPTTEQIEYFQKVILDHKKMFPTSNSIRYISQLNNLDYKCNPWKCIQIDNEGILEAPCHIIAESRFNLREHRLSEIWKEVQTQKLHEKYSNCKMCNYGCVAEAAWSTYDLGFVINETFRGIAIPTLKRIKARNNNNIKKLDCKLEYPKIQFYEKLVEPVLTNIQS